jgi:hypothetical protein
MSLEEKEHGETTTNSATTYYSVQYYFCYYYYTTTTTTTTNTTTTTTTSNRFLTKKDVFKQGYLNLIKEIRKDKEFQADLVTPNFLLHRYLVLKIQCIYSYCYFSLFLLRTYTLSKNIVFNVVGYNLKVSLYHDVHKCCHPNNSSHIMYRYIYGLSLYQIKAKGNSHTAAILLLTFYHGITLIKVMFS